MDTTIVTPPRTRSSRLRRAGAALAVAGAMVGTSLGFAGTAAAASPTISSNSSDGANLRTCANTGCDAIIYLYNGTTVSMQCYTDAQTVSPPHSNYTSPRWFRVAGNGQVGYVHSSLVVNQTSVPGC